MSGGTERKVNVSADHGSVPHTTEPDRPPSTAETRRAAGPPLRPPVPSYLRALTAERPAWPDGSWSWSSWTVTNEWSTGVTHALLAPPEHGA